MELILMWYWFWYFFSWRSKLKFEFQSRAVLNKHKFNVISIFTKYVSGIKIFLNEWIKKKRFTNSSYPAIIFDYWQAKHTSKSSSFINLYLNFQFKRKRQLFYFSFKFRQCFIKSTKIDLKMKTIGLKINRKGQSIFLSFRYVSLFEQSKKKCRNRKKPFLQFHVDLLLAIKHFMVEWYFSITPMRIQ